jgi:hypothetical protein
MMCNKDYCLFAGAAQHCPRVCFFSYCVDPSGCVCVHVIFVVKYQLLFPFFGGQILSTDFFFGGQTPITYFICFVVKYQLL